MTPLIHHARALSDLLCTRDTFFPCAALIKVEIEAFPASCFFTYINSKGTEIFKAFFPLSEKINTCLSILKKKM